MANSQYSWSNRPDTELEVSPEEEMQFHDTLPPALRQAVDTHPFPYSSKGVALMLQSGEATPSQILAFLRMEKSEAMMKFR